ncbi:MAG: Crp/Fnr family transcriptional regulator [Flavobacteriales bacterium]
MSIKTLAAAIKKTHPSFNDDILASGIQNFEKIEVKAKEVILEACKTCHYIYFAPSSIIRCYYLNQKGEEHTLWMKPEASLLTEYKSYVTQQPSTFSLQCYEDTELYRISRENLFKLYSEHTDWALFGIHLTEAVHVSLIDVFVNLLSNDATRNYQYIAYAFPRFIQVAPLKDIASILQISAVSLSRIRSGTQTKDNAEY